MQESVLAQVFFQKLDLQSVLITGMCGLIVFYMSKRRFDILAIDVDWKELSNHPRSWTSSTRYVSALCCYCSLNLIFFRLLLFFPEALVRFAQSDLLPVPSPTLGKFLDLPYIHPPLAVLVLVALFDSKFGVAQPVERSLRRRLQQLGSVPRYVRQLIRRLQQAEISPVPASGLPSVDTKEERVRYLRYALEWLREDGSPDGPRRFLFDHRVVVDDLLEQAARAVDLEAVLARQYLVLSCALASVGAREADAALRTLGIEAKTFDDTDPHDVIKALQDDITLSVGFLCLVVYPAILAAFMFVGRWKPERENGWTIGILWPLMLLSIMLPGLLAAFFSVRRHIQTDPDQQPPYMRCAVVGLLAGVFSSALLLMWELMHPYHDQAIAVRAMHLLPFGFATAALSISLALTLLVPYQRSRHVDAAVIGACTGIGGVVACLIGDINDPMHIALSAALLAGMGFSAGCIIPHAYRRRLGRPARGIVPPLAPPSSPRAAAT